MKDNLKNTKLKLFLNKFLYDEKYSNTGNSWAS